MSIYPAIQRNEKGSHTATAVQGPSSNSLYHACREKNETFDFRCSVLESPQSQMTPLDLLGPKGSADFFRSLRYLQPVR